MLKLRSNSPEKFKHIKEGNPTRQMGRYQQFMDNDIREDRGEIITRMAKYQAALKRGTPPELDKSERLKLEKQALKDREWLKKTLCPKSLYYIKESNPDFKKAVERAKIERSPEFNQVSGRYQNAMRQLDTETPDASSIEKLRPK